MSKGTAHRTVRIDDDLWQAAQEAAGERGDNISDIIRQALQRYLEPPATRPGPATKSPTY